MFETWDDVEGVDGHITLAVRYHNNPLCQFKSSPTMGART